MFVAPDLFVNEAAIELRFVRASGPGGQNVNKVSTAVELRFDISRSGLGDPAMLQRLAVLADGRLTLDGTIVIRAERFRTQEQNRSDARARLAELLRIASTPPKPRRATRPPRSAERNRLEDKRRRAAIKANRRPDDPEL